MRAFLALELPDEIRREIEALERELARTLSDWRWIRPEALHLTLRFLGEIEERAELEARAVWAAAAGSVPPFRLRVRGLGCFPGVERPRVLWIGVEEADRQGRLLGLVDALERAARAAGFPPERRCFEPHLSLARAARGARPRGPASSAAALAGTIPVRQVVLFESKLESTGARYTARARFPLGDATGRS